MNRTLAVLIIVLIAMLAVQSYRVHALKREHTVGMLVSTSGNLSTKSASRQESDSGAPNEDSSHSELHAAQSSIEVPIHSAPSENGTSVSVKPPPQKLSSNKENTPKSEAALAREAAAQIKKNIARANKSYADGEHDAALALLRDTLEEFPGDPQAFSALAKLYADLGMIDEAIKTYNDWTAANPDDARAFLAQAGLYESLGMNAESVASLAQYEEIKQGAPDSYSAAASMYRRLGMPQEELAALQGWVDSAPTSPQATLALGEYYRRTGDLTTAVAQYQQATTLAPGNVTAHVSLATAYQQLGDHANAQLELNTALALHPGDASLYMRLADSYRRSGDLNAAIGTYENVVSMEPSSVNATRATQQIARLQRQLATQNKAMG